MNIKDKGIWVTEEVPQLNAATFTDLLDKRHKSFMGFLDREATKGFIKSPTNLATSQGQEMLRIMLFRVIEEFVEAYDSKDPDHIKEELIDAINYLWGAWFIPMDSYPYSLAERLCRGFYPANFHGLTVTSSEISRVVLILGRLGDYMRNRAWMNQAQDLYFAGAGEFEDAVVEVSAIIFSHFMGWEDFYRFFVSKDNVLQFRLRTNY